MTPITKADLMALTGPAELFAKVENLTKGKAKSDEIVAGDLILCDYGNGKTVRRQYHEPPPIVEPSPPIVEP